MAAERLPDGIREFTEYLRGLLARLDPSGGWCAVFRQRDPEGMRACLDGREPPPWDVVEALLRDLAAAHGAGAADAETPHARYLHTAALAAYDARPGAGEALSDRLDVMLREQKYAAERRADLTRRLASAATREQADTLRLDLAWAQDDHERATARCAEITARMTALDRRSRRPGRVRRARRDDTGPHVPRAHPGAGGFAAGATGPADAGSTAAVPGPGGGAPTGGASVPEAGRTPAARSDGAGGVVHDLTEREPAPAPGARRRRRGGARFAGVAVDEEAGPVVVPPAAAPGPPAPGSAPGRTPRGARFAGAADEGTPEEEGPRTGRPLDAVDRREAGRVVAALARLRREGRGGEAHALLIETAYGPAARFPLLADEMRRAGLEADWATLLWEAAASLPAERLVTTADALTAAGRADDGERILRQGVVRPADEIGRAVLALDTEARHRELRALLDACLRMRTPEDAARTAAPDPRRLVPLLLAAARGVSDERHRDLLRALRVAGFAA
jgi:hypothetical protein